MANEQRRRGFCPRVWTPMASGDGLLVRIHTATRWLDAAQIERLAELASAHGNGLIEITRRANLQLRGVRPASLEALQQELVTLGLAADSAWGERRFVLHASPWLGLDPACASLAPLLAELERLLVDPDGPERVHPKLAITLSGPRAELGELGADLAIALDPAHPTLARLELALTPQARLVLGLCPLSDVGTWVANWLERLSTPPAPGLDRWPGQRVHQWIDLHGRNALEHHAPRSLEALDGRDAAQRQVPAAPEPAERWIGFHAAPAPWLGVMVPFGAADAQQWRALAALSVRFGDGSMRTHPARGLLLRGVAAACAPQLSLALAQQGMCIRADDPLTRVVACAGAPACTSALGETRQLARELAQLTSAQLARGATLHVSGCDKCCARSGPSHITVVHGPDGAHLAFGADAAGALQTPALSLTALHAALSARVGECATSAPYPSVEPDAP